MTLSFGIIIGLIIGAGAMAFINGVFPLKETLEEVWRSKTIAFAILLGVIGVVGIFQQWTMVAALCVFILCGMVVLTKFMAKNQVAEAIRDMQFWVEVKLQEVIKILNNDEEDLDKDTITKIIKDKINEPIVLTDQQLQNARAEGGKIYIDDAPQNNGNKRKTKR